jgi:hypothetical protein
MAGYSGTPLAKKLGIKAGHTVGLFGAPEGFEATLEGLPEGVTLLRGPGRAGRLDVMVCFFTWRADLEKSYAGLSGQLDPAGGLWIAWPKKSSGLQTDLTENILREVVLPSGMVDNKVCAVDKRWSGLRFVWRLENRPGGAAKKRA